MTSRRCLYYIIGVTAMFVTGCAGGHDGQKPDGATPVVKQAAAQVMRLAADRPEQALQTIDSLRAEGMADYETNWLRAKVYCQSLEGTRLDSAIAICERLMLLDVARENREYRQDVLETLVNACQRNNDDERILRWTAELVTLFHENGDETEALRSEAEIAVALTHTGHLHEGLAKIDSVIATLGGKRKFNELDASMIALKRKVGLLSETGRYADIIPVAQSMLDRLADYEQHPDNYHDGSYREPADEDRAGYIDFYRNRAYGYLAEAYARTAPLSSPLGGKPQSATITSPKGEDKRGLAYHYLALYEQSGYGWTQEGRHFIVPTLCLLGESAKMDSIFQDLDEARFHAYEQQMEIERKDAETKHARQIAIGLNVVVLLLLVIIFLLFRHHRIVKRKNRVIVEQITEKLEIGGLGDLSFSRLGESLNDQTTKQLFEHISHAIISEQLYLQPLFDREAAATHFGISSRRIGAAFTQGSPYKSLPDFIRECRLRHACRLLRDTTMTIADIAAASGFSRITTFNHDFKAKYELTPTEFRSQLNS
ncbi:MAG: AraC family transcriptional regulator [Prevotella sp.]|nr:AraC family transcriptional regulator [Prevotella sp.]MBR0050018.1 AraC family transcriptional regulator [Prevotella sp.]